MKIKVVAYTSNEEGAHQPGEILDMREAKALQWIKMGWAIARPDLEEKAKEPEPVVERAVIETPEDDSSAETRETATMKRKKK